MVDAMRKAFSAAMRDPGFIAEAKKQNIEIKEIPGESVAEALNRAYSMPPDVIKAAKEAMNLSGGGTQQRLRSALWIASTVYVAVSVLQKIYRHRGSSVSALSRSIARRSAALKPNSPRPLT